MFGGRPAALRDVAGERAGLAIDPNRLEPAVDDLLAGGTHALPQHVDPLFERGLAVSLGDPVPPPPPPKDGRPARPPRSHRPHAIRKSVRRRPPASPDDRSVAREWPGANRLMDGSRGWVRPHPIGGGRDHATGATLTPARRSSPSGAPPRPRRACATAPPRGRRGRRRRTPRWSRRRAARRRSRR